MNVLIRNIIINFPFYDTLSTRINYCIWRQQNCSSTVSNIRLSAWNQKTVRQVLRITSVRH